MEALSKILDEPLNPETRAKMHLRLLRADLFLKPLPWCLAASAIGLALAVAVLTALQACGYLRALSHSVALQMDPLV